MGMKSEEVVVGNKTMINVTMTEESIGLEEVVAVGYGTVKKSDVTGAVARISEESLKERPVNNVLQAMQGKSSRYRHFIKYQTWRTSSNYYSR